MAFNLLRRFDPIHKESITYKLRKKRFAFFRKLAATIESDRPLQILDVGGTEKYWESMGLDGSENVQITLLNLDECAARHENFISLQGNACDLSAFDDQQFDIVFSNSVIEHLYSKENQCQMADEVRRVGKCYYVQTPNYYFPIEPHWLFPCFQFLPFSWRVFLTKNLNLGHYKKAASKEEAIRQVEEVKLLTEKDMRELFPEGMVFRERFFGLIKSVTMYYFPNAS